MYYSYRIIQKAKSENSNIRASVDMPISLHSIRQRTPSLTSFMTIRKETPLNLRHNRCPLTGIYIRFFVAIPPAMHTDWGKQMAKLIKPGEYLITLIYPIVDYGPPYYIRPEHYIEPLGCFENVLQQIPGVSTETHVGRERLVVWRRL